MDVLIDDNHLISGQEHARRIFTANAMQDFLKNEL